MNIKTVFGVIGHDLKVVADDAWHVIELLGHDADAVVVDALEAAVKLGFSKVDVLAALGHAATAVENYTAEKFPTLAADALGQLQHDFVASSLVQSTGLGQVLSTTLSAIVSRIVSSGSAKVEGLLAQGAATLAAQAGLTL